MAEYTETAVLVAAMEGDIVEVERRLGEFNTSELSYLQAACQMILDEIDDEYGRRPTGQRGPRTAK